MTEPKMIDPLATQAIRTEPAPPSYTPPAFPLPLNDRVLLRRLDSPSTTSALASGFVLPETSKEKATECEVLAIPARPYTTDIGAVLFCPVRVGDHVLIGKYSGAEHKLRRGDGKEEEVLFVRWGELLGVTRKGGEFEHTQEGLELLRQAAWPWSFAKSSPPDPSAADLDAVAAEVQIKYATSCGYNTEQIKENS